VSLCQTAKQTFACCQWKHLGFDVFAFVAVLSLFSPSLPLAELFVFHYDLIFTCHFHVLFASAAAPVCKAKETFWKVPFCWPLPLSNQETLLHEPASHDQKDLPCPPLHLVLHDHYVALPSLETTVYVKKSFGTE
jgi:hypothetical protein